MPARDRAAYFRQYRRRRKLDRLSVPEPVVVPAVPSDPAQAIAEWARSTLVIPDGLLQGQPFQIDDWQLRFLRIDLLLNPDESETRAQTQSQTEYRADTVTPVDSPALADGSQASVLERIFTRAVAAKAGVSMPSVPVGAAVYPIMTSGTAASMAADGTEADAAAGAFTGHTLEPTRLTAAYLFNARQTLQLRNFEAILRRDLAAVMSDAMDDQIINGNGTAPNVSGFLHELTAPTAAEHCWQLRFLYLQVQRVRWMV